MGSSIGLSPFQRIMRWFLDFEAPTFSKKDIHHFLFINWHGKIGDAFISSFLIRELKKIHHLNTVSVITTPELKNIYEVFNVDNIYVIDRCNRLDFYSLILKIKKIDAIIPLLGVLDFKHFFLFHVLKPKIIFGLDQSLRLINPSFLVKSKGCVVHDVYKNILFFLDYKNHDDSYILPKFEKVKKYDIVINPFGSRPDKSLSSKKLDSIIASIYDNFSNVKMCLISHLEDEDLIEMQNRYKSKALELIKVNSIFDSIDVLSCSRSVISVDTSIVHIAAGLKINTIAIYCMHDSEVNIWHPRQDAPVSIIYSRPSFHKKNMNFFDNELIILQLRSFWKKGDTDDE